MTVGPPQTSKLRRSLCSEGWHWKATSPRKLSACQNSSRNSHIDGPPKPNLPQFGHHNMETICLFSYLYIYIYMYMYMYIHMHIYIVAHKSIRAKLVRTFLLIEDLFVWSNCVTWQGLYMSLQLWWELPWASNDSFVTWDPVPIQAPMSCGQVWNHPCPRKKHDPFENMWHPAAAATTTTTTTSTSTSTSTSTCTSTSTSTRTTRTTRSWLTAASTTTRTKRTIMATRITKRPPVPLPQQQQ